MKYIIKIESGVYYLCKSLIINTPWGFKAACGTTKKDAKRFRTYAKAEHTMNRLIRTCVNATNAEIEEVEEWQRLN